MEELIRQYLDGDDEAFTKIIQLIQVDLFRIARARLDNIEDINDAIQETMILSYKNLKKLEEIKYFKTWIIKILINECNKIYQQKKKKMNIFQKLTKNKEFNLEACTDIILEAERKMDLENILRELSYEEKIAIVLFYGCDYSLIEIANILGVSSNTIKSRITRAKQKIKTMYKGGAKSETI